MMQTDIEIYIKSASPDAIKLWLEICTSRLDVQSSNPKRQAYWATFADANNQQAEFEIIVLNKVQSNFSSVWFNTKIRPGLMTRLAPKKPLSTSNPLCAVWCLAGKKVTPQTNG